MAASTNWKLTLAYDGSGFHGWQVQPGLTTVQGTLSEAIARITGERCLPQGSGRTDAGVHALAQVVSFRLATPVPAANLHRALNRLLPASIRVLSCEEVPYSFHARHSALSKTYEYRIFERRIRLSPGQPALERICPPFLAPYAWDCRWPLSPDAMTEAAGLLLGSHDFTSMAATDPDRTQRDADDGSPSSATIKISPVKTITLAEWSRRPGPRRRTSSSSASPAAASSTTWCATLSAHSSKSAGAASRLLTSRASSTPATAPPPAPPRPHAASTLSKSSITQ